MRTPLCSFGYIHSSNDKEYAFFEQPAAQNRLSHRRLGGFDSGLRLAFSTLIWRTEREHFKGSWQFAAYGAAILRQPLAGGALF